MRLDLNNHLGQNTTANRKLETRLKTVLLYKSTQWYRSSSIVAAKIFSQCPTDGRQCGWTSILEKSDIKTWRLFYLAFIRYLFVSTVTTSDREVKNANYCHHFDHLCQVINSDLKRKISFKLSSLSTRNGLVHHVSRIVHRATDWKRWYSINCNNVRLTRQDKTNIIQK